jgi:hypothetical protein
MLREASGGTRSPICALVSARILYKHEPKRRRLHKTPVDPNLHGRYVLKE